MNPLISPQEGSGPFASQLMFERLMEIARASALEEMASGIAHELNQPLGAIATFAQAGERMLDRPEPMIPAALDVLRQITTEALGAGEGIRRIRKLFQRDTPTRNACAVGDLVYELLPLLELVAHRANGRLDLRVPAGLPKVMADGVRIQHVIFTLVQNAFEASRPTAGTGNAQPTVVVEISGDRYTVEVSVTDAGAGIAPEAREQIFRPFFTTKPHGTGLGLASSRAIVESHDGTIGFADAPGGGVRFWFHLPALSNEIIPDTCS